MNMKRLVFVLLSVAVFVCAGPKASASIGGRVGPNRITCGSGGTLYTNSTPSPISFDLSVTNSSCMVTVSWTDATGHPQTLTVLSDLSEGLPISVAAGSVISWTSESTGSNVFFEWELERVPLPEKFKGHGAQ